MEVKMPSTYTKTERPYEALLQVDIVLQILLFRIAGKHRRFDAS